MAMVERPASSATDRGVERHTAARVDFRIERCDPGRSSAAKTPRPEREHAGCSTIGYSGIPPSGSRTAASTVSITCSTPTPSASAA